MNQEHISALVDGEVTKDEAQIALAAIRQQPGQDSWTTYHLIGDILRSEDVTLRPDFAQRLATRLEAEPAHVQPASVSSIASVWLLVKSGLESVRKFLPGCSSAMRSH
jgi:negative regulator of sigma E activity